MNLRKEARGQDCQIRIAGVCNRNPETTVLAHFRLSGISGAGQKAPDIMGAWACSDCHTYVDSRHNDRDTRAFLEGIMRTQYKLIKQGKISW